MAYEPSEIAAAVALQYTKSELKKMTTVSDLKKIIEAGIIDKQLVQFGNGSIEKGFVKLLDANDSKMVQDMAIGISAAIGIRDFMSEPTTKIVTYMTGNIWPADVREFQVRAFGFEDYNSSDIVCAKASDKKSFYGISLKKKNTVKAADPTLINKAFATVFDGKEFDKLKEKLIKSRITYFANIIREAVKKQIILKEDILNFDKLSDEQLFESPKKIRSPAFDRSYIDTKGHAKAKNKYKDSSTTDPRSMRYFVNKKLSEKTNNKLWKAFVGIIDEGSTTLADNLINIILKTNLNSEIDAKNIKNKNFIFALVTAIGKVKDENVTISKAQIYPLKTTLCGLQRIEDKYKNYPYQVVQDAAATQKSNAAKIFFTLKRGNMKIMNLEIRYKGSFKPQPQFQANMTEEFKREIKKECSG
jgi:hypothetical protein